MSSHRRYFAPQGATGYLEFSYSQQNVLLSTFRDFQQVDDSSITDLLAERFDQFQLLSTASDVHTIVCHFET